MKTLVFSPKAEADIDGIYDYTEDYWGADQAEEYTFGLRDACGAIAAGRRHGKLLSDRRPGYLASSYKSHHIIYRETKQSIIIVRILHQRMNPPRHL